jgi:putative ABC transport system substrate-binding protein
LRIEKTARLVVTLAVFAAPLVAEAQQSGNVPRVGFLYFGSRQSALETGRYDAFVKGMRELGYVQGKTVIFEERFADSKSELLPDLVTELLRLKMDIIVATGSPVYNALRRATTTMPIVITVSADPVGEGLAASLARPGGNITGLSDAGSDVFPKQIELLTTCVPKLTRITPLWNSTNSYHPKMMRRIQAVAQEVGLKVTAEEAHTPDDIQRRFVSMARDRTSAVLLLPDTFFVQQLKQISLLTLQHRIPSIAGIRQYAELGGLMTYGQNITDNFRRAATYVDKILKGAKPADLPVEQPTKFELVVNLKTAKALGLTIPQSILVRADEVIQ